MADDHRSGSNESFRWLETRLENVVNLKASKEFVASEMARIRDQIYMVRDKMEDVEERIGKIHQCNQTGVFDATSKRLDSIKSDLDHNADSIKKLYIWQAGVGISLLVFFLTIGVASLRYVDRIDFKVQKNQEAIERVDERLKHEVVNEREMRKILRETLKSTSTYQ